MIAYISDIFTGMYKILRSFVLLLLFPPRNLMLLWSQTTPRPNYLQWHDIHAEIQDSGSINVYDIAIRI
jgi:hypothetical protein